MIPTRSFSRIRLVIAFLVIGYAFPSSSQDAADTGVAAKEVDALALITTLAMKANEGDETAARSLAARLLSGGKASVDEDFEKAVEGASPAEAARILGLTLLRSGNPELQAEGVAFLEKAVAAESVLAMEVMAQIRIKGEFGTEPSIEEAVRLLRRARQLPGSREAHRILGDLSLSGEGVPQDAAIALEHYRQGAEAGSVACLLALHRLFSSGVHVPPDLKEAERFGKAAAERGGAEIAFELALFYEQNADIEGHWNRAAEWLRFAMERGHGGATTRLSGYYLTDRLGEPNPGEAIRLLRGAAGMGDGEACFRIGEEYEKGEHLPQDPVASTAWIRIGADFGFAAAENVLGLRLITGYGIASDPVQAAQWFTRATNRGFAPAMVNLGELHEKGVGVPANPAEAIRLYTVAAEAGHNGAQERLARILSEIDDPALKDIPSAAYWAALAAEAGADGSVELANRLRESLSPEQREELARRINPATGEKSPQE